jgi:hypothetical protein
MLNAITEQMTAKFIGSGSTYRRAASSSLLALLSNTLLQCDQVGRNFSKFELKFENI